MTIVARHVNTQMSRVFMGTITGRAHLHDALAAFAQDHDIYTATFELLGGLHEVELTAYDFETQERLRPLTFSRPMEIIAGHGTISQLDGAPHVHTHLTLSFRDENAPHGIAVIGGHAARALAFAVEFTLTAYDGRVIQRKRHPETGLKLWDCAPGG